MYPTRCLMLAGLMALTMPLAAAECTGDASPDSEHLRPLAVDERFWKLWGDGQAELAGYDLTIRRYGQSRSGTAVAVFVTETLSNRLRVKADPGRHPAADEFPVMKLNLIQDFPTGIYDYNLMTSVFSALVPVNGLPAGAITKVSFSAQEWCGHSWQQALFGSTGVKRVSHSYFDGEADQESGLPLPRNGLPEDGLLLWARGFAGPSLEPGGTCRVPLLDGLRASRFGHLAPAWRPARLSRGTGTSRLEVPAGTFEVETWEAAVDGGRTWTILVEAAPPHRIVRWSHTEGESAELLAADRMKYWEMNGLGLEPALERLGLKPRTARTP